MEPERPWIEIATESEPSCTTPALPRYLAAIPNWTNNRIDPESETLLGERIWPRQESEKTSDGSSQDNNEEVIGKGRPEICSCQNPGSVECINIHVTEEKNRLKNELGPAFEEWKFEEMGEDVAKSWSTRDQNKFKVRMEKRNQASAKEKKRFLQFNWQSIRGKERKSLISYYFNVYIRRRISNGLRSGNTVDSEVELENEPVNSDYSQEEKGANTRNRHSVDSKESSAKKKYLAGRR